MRAERQYSVLYLLGEIALIAIALAAGRLMLHPSASWIESQAMCYCIALTAGCGAVGGACLRMAVGLVAGGVIAVASMPMLWVLIGAARL